MGQTQPNQSNGKAQPIANQAVPDRSISETESRRRRRNRFLPASVREVVLAEIAHRSKDVITDEVFALNPEAGRRAAVSMVNTLVREPDHRWVRRAFEQWERLADAYRRGVPCMPVRPTREQPPIQAVAQPAPIQQYRPPNSGFSAEMVATMASTIAGAIMQAMSPLLAQPQAPQLYQAPTAPVPTSVKQFHEHGTAHQRAILHSMHGRYADSLKASGSDDRAFAKAWNMSYEQYHKDTGINVKALASAESDRTGTHVKPVEIIERNGDLVRFWEIVRRLWES